MVGAVSGEHTYFLPTPLGLEEALAGELRTLIGREVEKARAGVGFSGSLEDGYRACLWSRVASRVLLQIATFAAPTPEALYEGMRAIDWRHHMSPAQTLAVDFSSTRSEIRHTNFGALKSKDAIVDQFRDRFGRRPSVDRENPDVQINVHVHEDVAVVGIDLSGEALHRRHWRARGGPAPMKENLAAGILLLARWPEVAAAGGGLVDPMCGAGTLPVEAALMAAGTAPGLLRKKQGFRGWRGHDEKLSAQLLEEARELDGRTRGNLPPIAGYDADPAAIQRAVLNARSAGVARWLVIERRELALVEPLGEKPGIVVVNPPYGERLGSQGKVAQLHQRFGMTLKQRFGHWTGFLFTGNLEAAKSVGLRSAARHTLYNGPLECRLIEYPVLPPKEAPVEEQGDAQGAEMFANRVRKNLRKLRPWLKREEVTCYRLYDADLPEYAFSVERYGEAVHVQENERPKTVDPLKAESRLHDAMAALSQVLEIPPERIFVKQRGRQRGTSQYEKAGAAGTTAEVLEGGLRFRVNLSDYFDTGLFLDHRPMRALIRSLAQGRTFLNLFAYTGTATVYAAAGGARTTTTVDLSRTYLDWAQENMVLNGFRGRNHRFEQDDVLAWLERCRERFGLVFLDPPTFSNSKSMRRDFDIQRDHVWLLDRAAGLLERDGVLLFSTNFRRFRMADEIMERYRVEEISDATIPPDFARTRRIHRAWRIALKTG
jgi:23S rRNA (guanine2445-N2)-methyltransferase / 23S rRNA (guanine2069-N7)-methyltransferase